jgi:hypothetical protein
MSDLSVQRLTGAFGVASGILILVGFAIEVPTLPLPRPEDAANFTQYMIRNNGLVLTISLVYTLSAACFVVFLAGLRHLIRRAKPDYEWVSALVFGAGLVYTVLLLVGFTFDMGAGLDTVNSKADPTVVRALFEGGLPAFGAIGPVMVALFLASVGYATLGAGALPRWTGWVAYVAAILNLAGAPSIYAGIGPGSFYAADGYFLGLGFLLYTAWLVIAGIAMVVKREAMAPPPKPAR